MRGRPFFCLRCHYGQVPAPGAESEALGHMQRLQREMCLAAAMSAKKTKCSSTHGHLFCF